MAQGTVHAATKFLMLVGVILVISPMISAGHPHPHPHPHPLPHGPHPTYFVGDQAGWTFRSEPWAIGKPFRAGDVLVFSYTSQTHNVIEVCQQSFDTCTVSPGAIIHTTGHDHIVLKPGMNFFICGFPNHCKMGMKLAINAAI